jgi:transcriptional regulator with XRE-family HTH domain
MNGIYAAPVKTDSDRAQRIGNAIEATRDYMGWTQPMLAAAAGTSTSTICRYENGTGDVRALTMLGIARAFGVPLEWLLDPPETRQEVFEDVAHFRSQRRASELGPS